MKTILLNVYEDTADVIEIADNINAFYKKLGCDLIDIVPRKIGRRWFDVMCDDEGLYAPEPKISAIDNLGNTMFVGNLMFFRHDNEGNLKGLSESDLNYILDRIQKMGTRKYPEGYMMLTQCEYK